MHLAKLQRTCCLILKLAFPQIQKQPVHSRKKKWSRETVLKEISIPREFEKDQEKKLHLANAKP